jgi:class 3 adenylate cyclase
MASNDRGQSQNFLGFIPAIVASYLNKKVKGKQSQKFPDKEDFKSVVMFADISGFTNLSERLSKKGQEGPELLAFALNRYMELLVKGIGRSGGDIFKFAGDAMIVLWPPPLNNNETELTTLCRQAIQSALDIQKNLHGLKLVEDIKLSVKIGFGVGDVTILHVGGVFKRAEYLAAGDPLKQAFESEHHATEGGKCIISKQMHDRIQGFFDFEQIIEEEGHRSENGPFYYVKEVRKGKQVQMRADALLISNNLKPSDIEEIRPALKSYLPAAVVPYVDIEQESWASELRKVTVLFINLGIDLSDAKSNAGLERIQTVIETVQRCVYKYQGSLNKLLMDDKGSTLLVVFGLPPMAHQDDAVRGVVAGMQLVKDLKLKNCSCSVGITTGNVYAGVVGTSGSRREYSILGDTVNLAARFMQMACGEQVKKVLVDVKTKEEAEYVIGFRFVKTSQVKGKTGEIEFFEPVDLEDDILKTYPLNIRTHRFTPLKVVK